LLHRQNSLTSHQPQAKESAPRTPVCRISARVRKT
jgi:hypothetical protein